MEMSKIFLSYLLAIIPIATYAQNLKTNKSHENNPYYSTTDTRKLNVSNAEWKKILTPDLYAVAREKDTERPFTGKYWKSNTKGNYYCAACGNKLFRSDAKFASSCGWPSFYARPGTVAKWPLCRAPIPGVKPKSGVSPPWTWV